VSFGRNKYQSRENRARVREILMRDWDPIGISGVEEAVDEYDAYVARAYVMLMDEQANAEAIAAYLFEIATANMGLSADRSSLAERSANAANALVALRAEIETH
jgi:hypothetical protein